MRRLIERGLFLLSSGLFGLAHADPVAFQQTNLVSSVPGLALFTDPNLRNPWGVSHSTTSPTWVSNQVTNTATLYNTAGVPQGLVVAILGEPTGQVFNSTASDFAVPGGGKSTFIFATLGGNIAAWNGGLGTNAQSVATVAGGVLTGLGLGNNGAANFLYAADEGHHSIDVFNNAFQPTTLSGSFTDPTLPSGFIPYNVQNLNGRLYVTYENESAGGGVVDAFDFNGNFLQRITANGGGGVLDSPWGLALAPAGFGSFGGALLVGNEGNGHIAAFDPTTGAFLGTLNDASNTPITNDGTWGLIFGNGGMGGDPNTLYVAAGIRDETQGLFAAIRPVALSVPEPGTLALLGLGLAVVGIIGITRRKRKR